MASIHTVVMQTTFIKAVTSMDIQSTVGISQCSSSWYSSLYEKFNNKINGYSDNTKILSGKIQHLNMPG